MEKLNKDNDKHIHIQIKPNTFVYVESFNSSKGVGQKFSLEELDGQVLKYKVMADRISWDDSKQKWHLKNYYIRTFDSLGVQTVEQGKEMDTTINLQTTDLYKIKERFEEMDFFELNAFIKREKQKGSIIYKKYEIEKQKRMAGPVAIIILTFIGVALSSRKVRGGIGLHLGVGIALTFSYIMLMQISTVFSTFGNLSPALGAWIPNFIYLLIGFYLLKKAPK